MKAYMLLQAVMMGYGTNNMYLDKYEKAQSDKDGRSAKVFWEQLQEFAPQLKKEHDQLTSLMEDLFEMLGKELP